MTPSCSCSTPDLVPVESVIRLPGQQQASVSVCRTCGRLPATHSTPQPPTRESVGAVLAELDELQAAGADESDLALELVRRHFDAGFIAGSAATARQLVEQVTFKGRLRRIRMLFPFNTPENLQEAQDLLLLGDQHGS